MSASEGRRKGHGHSTQHTAHNKQHTTHSPTHLNIDIDASPHAEMSPALRLDAVPGAALGIDDPAPAPAPAPARVVLVLRPLGLELAL